MFIITHDLEAALICDKAAILREGKMLAFDSPQKLINSLPSNGMIARVTIENLNQQTINVIRQFSPIQEILRVGNEVLEIMMNDFEVNLPKLIQFLVNKGLNVTAMSRDLATFRRFFQIRIKEEEQNEEDLESLNVNEEVQDE